MPRSARSSADAISARLRDLELLTKGPAWALTRSAPWVIAVLQASFTRTRPQLPLEEFHADVDSFLEQLRRQEPGGAAAGTSTGRNYADEWTRKNFLTRRNQSGQIVYEVTEPAARVLAFLDSLSSERSTLNGSRLGTLLGDVEKLANETNPDQSARLESLEEEIGERQQLIQDISTGDFDGLLDDDEAVEAAGNILDLAASLPADYKKMRDRIEELVGELRNQIIEESLSKGATMAQVLEADKRLRQSPEGRTFRSFTAFLDDPQQQMRFRSAIGEVLSRQFADDLSPEDRETLKNLVAELRHQHGQIQRIYGKLSESLNTYVQSDDFRQSVRLRKVLREAEQAIRSLPYERERAGLVRGPGAVQCRLRIPRHGQALSTRTSLPSRPSSRTPSPSATRTACARRGQARRVPRPSVPPSRVPPPWPRPGRSCPPTNSTSTPSARSSRTPSRKARPSTAKPGTAWTSNRSTAPPARRTCRWSPSRRIHDD